MEVDSKMKALIAIDTAETVAGAITLFERLLFPRQDVVLLHVVESMFPDGSLVDLPDSHPVKSVVNQKRREGQEALFEHKFHFERTSNTVKDHLKLGSTVYSIMDTADEEEVDLIVAGSNRKGYLGSLFLGSVTKGLVSESRQSMLFGKGEVEDEKGPLRVIFATDHSPYSQQCLNTFLGWKPDGVGSVVVLHAFDPRLEDEGRARAIHLTNASAERLREHFPNTEARVVDGEVHEVIADAMRDADLLVIGAQGHGFLDRLRMGSVSFRQVVAEPHHVLVLRP
jgi:nucleotide-binding universal stress UspA family protein